MSKYKLVSYLFIILGLLVIAGVVYVIISYASDLINAIVNFVTSSDYSKLQQCGVTPPSQFYKLQAEFATLILPALYIGLPALLAIVSALMFLAGFYFHRGKMEDDSRKSEELERQMVHKIVQKMEIEKTASPPPRVMPRPAEPEEPAEEEPEEEMPQPKIPPKKKR